MWNLIPPNLDLLNVRLLPFQGLDLCGLGVANSPHNLTVLLDTVQLSLVLVALLVELGVLGKSQLLGPGKKLDCNYMDDHKLKKGCKGCGSWKCLIKVLVLFKYENNMKREILSSVFFKTIYQSIRIDLHVDLSPAPSPVVAPAEFIAQVLGKDVGQGLHARGSVNISD